MPKSHFMLTQVKKESGPASVIKEISWGFCSILLFPENNGDDVTLSHTVKTPSKVKVLSQLESMELDSFPPFPNICTLTNPLVTRPIPFLWTTSCSLLSNIQTLFLWMRKCNKVANGQQHESKQDEWKQIYVESKINLERWPQRSSDPQKKPEGEAQLRGSLSLTPHKTWTLEH